MALFRSQLAGRAAGVIDAHYSLLSESSIATPSSKPAVYYGSPVAFSLANISLSNFLFQVFSGKKPRTNVLRVAYSTVESAVKRRKNITKRITVDW